jgi:hypothetical protein
MVLEGALIREHLVQAQVIRPHSIAVRNVSGSVAGRQDESGDELIQGQYPVQRHLFSSPYQGFLLFPGFAEIIRPNNQTWWPRDLAGTRG